MYYRTLSVSRKLLFIGSTRSMASRFTQLKSCLAMLPIMVLAFSDFASSCLQKK